MRGLASRTTTTSYQDLVRALTVALFAMTILSCAEPTLQFFSAVDGPHRPGRMVTDTVLLFRFGEPDSVAREGVDLAFDLLDRATQAQNAGVAGRIERVLSVIPPDHRVRKSKPGRRETDLVSGLSAQNLLNHVVLLRADYLVVSDVTGDTVELEVESPDESPARIDRWLSLIVTGQTAVADTL